MPMACLILQLILGWPTKDFMARKKERIDIGIDLPDIIGMVIGTDFLSGPRL